MNYSVSSLRTAPQLPEHVTELVRIMKKFVRIMTTASACSFLRRFQFGHHENKVARKETRVYGSARTDAPAKARGRRRGVGRGGRGEEGATEE